jgi:hypothetical protein
VGLRQGKALPIEGQHIVSAAGRSYTEQRVGVMVDADSKPLAPAFNKSVVGRRREALTITMDVCGTMAALIA